ncbi:ELAV-like protein 1 [Sarcoptes scabiei]|nr:ELAV-like protein 1 [Sarcoptes scabiei]
MMNNKKIKVSLARPSSDEIKNANIYVTNLPPNYTETDVRNLFKDCGEIIQCRLLTNRAGTAFVLFNLHEEARQAINEFNKKLIPGTNARIRVKFATNEPNKKNMFKDDSSAVINLTQRHNNFNHGGQFNHRNNNNQSNNNRTGPIRNTSHHNRYNPLQSQQGQYNYSSPMNDHNHMLYSDRHQLTSSQNPFQSYSKMDPSYISGSNNNDSSFMPPAGYGNGGAEPGQYILFVYNIGPETDEFNLGKLFSFYGHVDRVDVIRKSGSGVGRGYGFVTMKFYQEAMNAIVNLNGYKFVNNRPLQVSFKKF